MNLRHFLGLDHSGQQKFGYFVWPRHSIGSELQTIPLTCWFSAGNEAMTPIQTIFMLSFKGIPRFITPICLRLFLFSLVGFKGNLSLLEVFFPGAKTQKEDYGSCPTPSHPCLPCAKNSPPGQSPPPPPQLRAPERLLAGASNSRGLQKSMGQNEIVRKPQVLAHVSIYQGSILGTYF